MLANAVLHPVICTSNLHRAESFYREVLGLRVRERSHGAAVFEVGHCTIRLSPVALTTPSAHTVLGFEVESIDRVVMTLAARGVQFERFDGFTHDSQGIVSTPDGARVAWLRDLDGNLLSIVQFA